jgi:hypothetical protein
LKKQKTKFACLWKVTRIESRSSLQWIVCFIIIPKNKKKPPTIPLLALPTATGQLVEIQQEFRVARSPIANPSSCFDGSFFLQKQTQKQKQKLQFL